MIKNKLKSYAEFIKITSKDFLKIGALFPSSRFTVRSIVKHVDSHATLVVEYGPGLGTVTHEILAKLGPTSRLIAIENNENFWPFLEDNKDPRLEIWKGSVLQFLPRLKELKPNGVPIIVSGIPLSLMKEEEQLKLLFATKEAIGASGKFIIYQHHPNIFKKMKRVFSKFKTYFEPLNFPPYFILVARN